MSRDAIKDCIEQITFHPDPKKAPEHLTAALASLVAKKNGHELAYGVDVEGGDGKTLRIDLYPGLKMGAQVYLFGHDSDGDLCVLLIQEKSRFKGEENAVDAAGNYKTQWNPPQGFLNGVDSKIPKEKIKKALATCAFNNAALIASPMQAALRELLEETGIDAQAEGVSLRHTYLPDNPVGQDVSIVGQDGNYVIQVVQAFYGLWPADKPLPAVADNFEHSSGDGTTIKAAWVKVDNMHVCRSANPDHDGALLFEVHGQSQSLRKQYVEGFRAALDATRKDSTLKNTLGSQKPQSAPGCFSIF